MCMFGCGAHLSLLLSQALILLDRLQQHMAGVGGPSASSMLMAALSLLMVVARVVVVAVLQGDAVSAACICKNELDWATSQCTATVRAATFVAGG